MFRTKTVDGVLAALNSAVSSLHDVAIAQRITATERGEQIAQLETEEQEAMSEAYRAERIAARLEELLA